MDEKDFSLRIATLRTKKGVSARDMSLSMGQNPGYINNIESGKSMPSLTGIFYICDYLNITPSELFDEEVENPEKLKGIIKDLRKLNDKQLDTISTLIKDIINKSAMGCSGRNMSHCPFLCSKSLPKCIIHNKVYSFSQKFLFSYKGF